MKHNHKAIPVHSSTTFIYTQL